MPTAPYTAVAAEGRRRAARSADPVLFLSLYSHVTPTMQRDAARAIGDSLFGNESSAGSNP